MNSFDSKIFCGMQLGRLVDVVDKFMGFIEPPVVKPKTLIEYIEYINMHLPENVFLEVTYPVYKCSNEQMIAHLNLLSEDENVTVHRMRQILKNLNFTGYGYVLGKLGIMYKSPTIYSMYYIYN